MEGGTTCAVLKDALAYSLKNAVHLLMDAIVQAASMGALSAIAAIFVLGWPGQANAEYWTLAWHIVGAIAATSVLQTVLVFRVRELISDCRRSRR